MSDDKQEVDYSLANADTITKYKDAATIAHKVLASVEKACVDGATLLSVAEAGDKQLEEETAKVYKGKKISKGIAFPTTISPDDLITPYTPLATDAAEASKTLKAGSVVKIVLGAHIDGFAAIVGSTIVVPGGSDVIEGEKADLLLAAHYMSEVFLRLIIPTSVSTTGGEPTNEKPITQGKINLLLGKVAEAYGVKIVESTTSFQFERNDIESKKRVVLNPAEGMKGEGIPDVGEAWGIEVQVSSGSGKTKDATYRPTLFRNISTTTYDLKRPSARQTMGEIKKKFGSFPFSLRQLEDERTAKAGVIECVRGNILRQYDILLDKDGKDVARLFTTITITKNGISKIAAPTIDLEKVKSDKKIADEEILKILEIPLSKAKKSKKKN